MHGCESGRNLDKVGRKAQDTAELFFDDVRVPGNNLLGEEGGGFIHLMDGLPQERLSIAVVAVAVAQTHPIRQRRQKKTRTRLRASVRKAVSQAEARKLAARSRLRPRLQHQKNRDFSVVLATCSSVDSGAPFAGC